MTLRCHRECLLLHLQKVTFLIKTNHSDTPALVLLCVPLEKVAQTGWVGKYEQCPVQCNKVTSCNLQTPTENVDCMRQIVRLVGEMLGVWHAGRTEIFHACMLENVPEKPCLWSGRPSRGVTPQVLHLTSSGVKDRMSLILEVKNLKDVNAEVWTLLSI